MRNVVRLILMNKRYFSYRILWKKTLNMLLEHMRKLSNQMQPKNDGKN